MDQSFDTVLVEYDDERGVGTITMNRPDALNALNGQLRDDIIAGLESLEERNEDADGVALRAVVLEGAGEKAFCAGRTSAASPMSRPAAPRPARTTTSSGISRPRSSQRSMATVSAAASKPQPVTSGWPARAVRSASPK